MKKYTVFTILLVMASLLILNCTKNNEEIRKPRLLITVKDDTGASVAGATVRLYKNETDPGIIKISDSTGVVIFYDLDPEIYYWLAEKGCKTNRNSQTTLNSPLIPKAIRYGYSVLTETGTLIIINDSPDAYVVSDSLFSDTLSDNIPFITYPRINSYTIHSEKLSTPGMGKDTLIQILCGDTAIIRLPY